MDLILNSELSPDLVLTSVSGNHRSLAKIIFYYYGQEYWIIMTPIELTFNRGNVCVEGFGDKGADLQYTLNRFHWPNIKLVFLKYQMMTDSNNL